MSTRVRDTRAQARYKEIYGILRERISTAIYPVGGALPSEAAFCREFQVSRFTIREALRCLQSEGLVSRQQGAGSTVIRARAEGAFIQSYESIDELFQFALATDYRVVSIEAVELDTPRAAMLDAEPGSIWTCQRGLRLKAETGAAMALIESFIPPRMQVHASALEREKPPFYAYLEQATGEEVLSVRQDVQAMAMPSEFADALGAKVGGPTLRLFRRYDSHNGPLIGSYNWHPGGEKFIYQTQLRKSVE